MINSLPVRALSASQRRTTLVSAAPVAAAATFSASKAATASVASKRISVVSPNCVPVPCVRCTSVPKTVPTALRAAYRFIMVTVDTRSNA